MSRLAVLALATRRFSVRSDQGELYAVQMLPEAKVQKIASGWTELSKAEPAERAAIAASTCS